MRSLEFKRIAEERDSVESTEGWGRLEVGWLTWNTETMIVKQPCTVYTRAYARSGTQIKV